MNHSGGGTDRMPTGISGFDDITEGGLPRGRVTVVLGAAGTGKTLFGLQVLVRGARDDEPGLLVAFEESAEQIVANASGFEWDVASLDGHGLYVLDARLSEAIEQSGPFDLAGLLAMVAARAKQVGAKRIVFDGIDVLLAYLGDPTLVRRELLRLREWVHRTQLSAIVTAKASDAGTMLASEYDSLQFMADAVVSLHHRVVQGTALRLVRVAKFRGTSHSANEFPLTITEAGLALGGNTAIDLTYPASTERVSTGVERLDTMLSGGYHRGSSVLVSGAPGTAKTSLAGAFAAAAAGRGERTLFVSFDEAAEQLVRNAASIGLRFDELVAAGTLRLYSLRARSASPDAHVARIRALLEAFDPRSLVIDPLSALTRPGNEAMAEDAALQILDIAKCAGITTVSTSLLANAVPLSEQTSLSVSTIADTWIHVSYVNHGGERNRALTIVKSRGTSHSNQVRELVLSDQGVTLADVYAVGGEVLMGTLRWQREIEALRAQDATRRDTALREKRAESALAGMRARAEVLASEQAVQEAELERIRADRDADMGHRTIEEGELRQRRGADAPAAPKATGPRTRAART